MSEPIAFLNGRFLPQAQATLPLHDAGFVMGATVTDLCRTFRHRLYRWEDHLERFFLSCRGARIRPAVTETEITPIAEELVRQNVGLLTDKQELVFILFATPGPVNHYRGEEGGSGDGPVTFGMHAFPLPFERYRRLITEGAALVVPSVRQLPPACVDPNIKMRSRLHWWLAEQEAKKMEPEAAALLLDSEGYITETAAANVLAVKNGKIFSPPRDCILQGVSRRVVMELSQRLGIMFEEKFLTLEDLLSADEALLTSTPYCLAGISRCQGKSIPWPGPVYRGLLKAWTEQIGLDVHGHILSV